MPWTRKPTSSSFAASSSKTRMNSSPMILRLRSGSSTPASLARKRSSASTWTSGMPNCSKASTTCSASFSRIRPWSTKTQVSRSPTARCTSSAATEESTPPERPQITRPSPTWAWTLRDLLGDHRLRRPLLLAAGDVAQEAGEDLGPVGRVDDLGVELDAVEAAVGHLAGGDRRAGAGGERGEALAAARRRRRGGSSSSCCSSGRPPSSLPPPSRRISSVRPNSPASAPSTLPPSAWTIACIP